MLQKSYHSSFDADSYYQREDERENCIATRQFLCHWVLLRKFGYVMGLWSRMAEIAIRTCFVVFTTTAALLFDELDKRIEEMATKSADCEEMMGQMNDWRSHYDLVCQLVEQINRSFGLVLLLITGHDFATAIMDFSNILNHLNVGNDWQKVVPIQGHLMNNKFQAVDTVSYAVRKNNITTFEQLKMTSDPIKTFQFAHPILRFLLLLVTSNRVGAKVIL